MNKIRLGINGFGRMGRLILRASFDWPEFEFVHINDPSGDAATFSHLLNFDSVHGRWRHESTSCGSSIVVKDHHIRFSSNDKIAESPWATCDIVIEASGKFKTYESLQPYLNAGVKKVVVTAPVHEESVPNIVFGVNDAIYEHGHHIVSAASCTTNCIAPIVKVIHENLKIVHGSITTIHDITNTQTIVDSAHKDLRRARSCGTSLIPTTTGSAKAIALIFPELKGKLNGHAIRVPLTNASLTDCVFEVETSTTAENVNAMLSDAAKGSLKGILGYEERPLVSIDYKDDPRSTIIDAPSTMVVNNTHIKLYAWYDNEWGYVNRAAELALKVGKSIL